MLIVANKRIVQEANSAVEKKIAMISKIWDCQLCQKNEFSLTQMTITKPTFTNDIRKTFVKKPPNSLYCNKPTILKLAPHPKPNPPKQMNYHSKAITYLACPICEASYTVGPQLYQVTFLPSWGTNTSFCLVKLLNNFNTGPFEFGGGAHKG